MNQNDSDRVLIETGEYQGRPFRKYSDGTVKAVTSDGWLKFQNFDALRDYHSTRVQQRMRKSSGANPLRALRKLFA